MRSSVASFLLFLVAAVTQAQLTINTPAALFECEPVALTFSGGTGPYIITAIPGGQPSAAPLTTIATAVPAGTMTITWAVNLAAGTSVTLAITDSTGVTAYDLERTIIAGASTACLTASGSPTAVGATTTTTTTTFNSGSSSSGSSASGSSASGTVTITTASGTTTTSPAASTISTASTSSKPTATTPTSAPASTTSAPASGNARALQASSIFAAIFAAAVALAA